MLLQRQVGKVPTASFPLPKYTALPVARANVQLSRNMSSNIPATAVALDAATAPSPAAEGNSFVSPVTVTSVDESQYGQQLSVKLAKLRELFQEFNPPELEVFESPPSHYRMRSEFTVEHRDGRLHYVMFDNSPAPAPAPAPAPEAPAGAAEAAPAAAGGTGGGEGGAAAAAAGSAGPARAKPGSGAPARPRRVRLEQFPVGSRQLNELMAAVQEEVTACAELRERLFQVNFHTTLAGDAMVTLIYHRKLGPAWQEAAQQLRTRLAATPTAAAAGLTPHVIGRSRKQKIELDAGFVLERLSVGGRSFTQKQVEAAFSQPNAAVCQHMLAWAVDVTRPQQAVQGGAQQTGEAPAVEGATAAKGRETETEREKKAEKGEAEGEEVDAASGSGRRVRPRVEVEEGAVVVAAAAAAAEGGEGVGAESAEGAGAAEAAEGPQDDLLELYCGNGNFTVPLAQNFRRVVATEVAKSSVEAARFNLAANGVSNVFLARMASEEFAETMRARGSRRRLEGLPAWEQLRLRTILVDPPRAGLDDFTVQLLQEFDRIVYISCNPDTLAANLRALGGTHRIARFAAFDQFPYTHHLECGVLLTRK